MEPLCSHLGCFVKYIIADISGIGQTRAALDLAANLPQAKKKYLLARDVGHYGIFNGSKWRSRIAPVVEAWIEANGKRARARPSI